MDPGRTTRRGLTLLELLLALAGTALIGAALALMLGAVTYASSQSTDIRSLVGRNHALKNRLDATLRSARQVLASGTDAESGNRYLILWMAVPDENENPRLSEVRRLDFNPTSNKLLSRQTTEAFNDNRDAPTNPSTVKADTDDLMGTDDFPQQLWASHVSDWQLDFDTANVQAARLVSYRLGMRAGQLTDTAIGATSLRN